MRAPLCLAVLLLLSLVVYWDTVFHEYGFRDDYAHLREVREEPGKLLKLTSSNGRPVYGLALEASLRGVHDVPDLAVLRLTSVVLLCAVGVVLWLGLRRSGWTELEAGAVGAAALLLPGAQVVIGWAIAWPIGLGLLAALLGFWLIDRHLMRSGLQRIVGLLAGSLLYLVAGLTYQTSALFAVVPLAATLLLRNDGEPWSHVRWAVTHVGILFASLVAGFFVMDGFFAEGVLPEAARMHLEPEPFGKLLWFVRQPLPNSLALFELRDRFQTQPAFWVAIATFGVVVALGFRYGASTKSQKLRWLFCCLVLPFVAHSVSLAASSQAIGYRTLLPLSGLFLVLVVYSLRSMARAGKIRPNAQTAMLAGLVAVAAVLAHRHSFTLIAQPQSREWQLVHSAANSLRLSPGTDVYIIRPTIADRSTERVYDDEFGSLSSDADWAAKEMFKTALRERFPAPIANGEGYSIETGADPPSNPDQYDLVVDLRKLRVEGDRRVAARVGFSTALRR